MKEKQGKLFGKINIVDLIVIVVIIIGIIAVAFKLGGGNALNGTKTKLTYTVLVEGVTPAVYDSLLAYIPGDHLMASGEILPATVTSVEATPHSTSATLATTTGFLQIPLQEDLLDLTFTVEAEITNTVTNELGTQEIRIGKTHIMKTQHFEFSSGTIQSCLWESMS